NSFKELAEMISSILGFGGKTVSLPVEDVIRQYGEAARLGVASNSLVFAANARRLGWSPKAPALAAYLESLERPRRSPPRLHCRQAPVTQASASGARSLSLTSLRRPGQTARTGNARPFGPKPWWRSARGLFLSACCGKVQSSGPKPATLRAA